MKELSIEEKAQRYDDAIDKIKYVMEHGVSPTLNKEDLQDIFPELKESEDERIRKALIEHFRWNAKQILNEFSNKKALAWLEKQGEIDKESYKIDEKEKREFVGDGFIKCYADFQDFKEGETYWLEYIGDDKYNVRSDNLLGKTYHITPCQLYTVFKKLTWLEKQDIFSKKDIDDAYLKGVRDTKNEIEKQYEANYQIRKDIATFIFNYKGNIKDRAKWMNYLGIKVSFVEKQGEKPADKVEPKFKVGDWVVREYTKDIITINQVVDFKRIDDKHFGYTLDDETYFSGSWENSYHLWTIQDAKDGDVLVTVDGERPFIYKGCLDPKHPDSPVAYCGINADGYFHSCSNKFNHWWTDAKVHPATKEQKDALLKAMADAGWEFDFERKEFKKIEQKSAWSEEDEKRIASILSVLSVQVCWDGATGKKINPYQKEIDWLKSLKKRLQK